jgi:hypothetical protein
LNPRPQLYFVYVKWQLMKEKISVQIPPGPLTPPLTPPLFNNLHEYFKPVFDELDKLNKILDSHIEEENDKVREKKK